MYQQWQPIDWEKWVSHLFCMCVYLITSFISLLLISVVGVVCIRTVNAIFYDIWHSAFLNVSSLDCSRAFSHSLFPRGHTQIAHIKLSFVFCNDAHTHTHICTKLSFCLATNEFNHHNNNNNRTNDNRKGSSRNDRRMNIKIKSIHIWISVAVHFRSLADFMLSYFFGISFQSHKQWMCACAYADL